MQNHKSRRVARILCAVLVVFGLWPLTAACSAPEPRCKQTTWSGGSVVVVADVMLVAVIDNQNRKIGTIPAETVLYPESQYACRNVGTWVRVQYDGKTGWVARDLVAQRSGTPSSAPTPRATGTTR